MQPGILHRLALAAVLCCLALPALANPDGIAVIIGNRDYARGIPAVPYAHNDAAAMRRFVVGVLGFRDGNVIDLRNAGQAQLYATFGSAEQPQGKLWSWVKQGRSDIVVFYSGHGVPGRQDRRGYLLPVDADPDTPGLNGYPLDLLYRNLAAIGARSVTVYLDACFSGNSAGGTLCRNCSGLAVVPRQAEVPTRVTVLSAARADQVAGWDDEARLGLFTRYLLQGLHGAADADGDRKLRLGEVRRYLDEEMTYAARRLYGRVQAVSAQGSETALLAALPADIAAFFPVSPAETAAASPEPVELVEAVSGKLVVQEMLSPVPVYAGAGDRFSRLAELEFGQAVTVTGKVKGQPWFRIELGDRRSGYVAAGQLLMPSRRDQSIRPLDARLYGFESFRDCDACPEMIPVPGPARSIAVGRFEVTRAEFAGFEAATRYDTGRECRAAQFNDRRDEPFRNWRDPGYRQTEFDPVSCVSWHDGEAYAAWLSSRTGQRYRLLSLTEWSHLAEAGPGTIHYWASPENACFYENLAQPPSPECADTFSRTAPVGRFWPNRYGLHDMVGNLAEWVGDCPDDRRPTADCRNAAVVGGFFADVPGSQDVARRLHPGPATRVNYVGFRVARELAP